MEDATPASGETPPSGLRCAVCGAENEADARFCAGCGRALQQPHPVAVVPQAHAGAVEWEYVGFWRRAGAILIDWAILFVVVILAAVTAGQGGLVQWLIIWMVYFVLFTGLRGQTPGKQVWGIRVVTGDGEIPGIGRAVMREVVGRIVSAIVLLLGYIWVVFDSRKQGWHDKIGGTYVIRAR